MNWYIKVLKNYVNFKGRARRKEYWFFQLFQTIILMVLGTIGMISNSDKLRFIDQLDPTSAELEIMMLLGPLFWIYVAATFLPALAVMVRRLHDINRSGAFVLLQLLPYIGPLILFIFSVLPGTDGDNLYGPDPLLEEYTEQERAYMQEMHNADQYQPPHRTDSYQHQQNDQQHQNKPRHENDPFHADPDSIFGKKPSDPKDKHNKFEA